LITTVTGVSQEIAGY